MSDTCVQIYHRNEYTFLINITIHTGLNRFLNPISDWQTIKNSILIKCRVSIFILVSSHTYIVCLIKRFLFSSFKHFFSRLWYLFSSTHIYNNKDVQKRNDSTSIYSIHQWFYTITKYCIVWWFSEHITCSLLPKSIQSVMSIYLCFNAFV